MRPIDRVRLSIGRIANLNSIGCRREPRSPSLQIAVLANIVDTRLSLDEGFARPRLPGLRGGGLHGVTVLKLGCLHGLRYMPSVRPMGGDGADYDERPPVH